MILKAQNMQSDLPHGLWELGMADMLFILETSLDSTLTFLHACVRCPVDPQLLQDFLGVLGEDARLSFLLTFNFPFLFFFF